MLSGNGYRDTDHLGHMEPRVLRIQNTQQVVSSELSNVSHSILYRR